MTLPLLPTTLTEDQVQHWANELNAARLVARERDRISTEDKDFTLEDAYRIQEAGIALRMKASEKVVGYKMGFTSEAKRTQMGLKTPIYGTLTDGMWVQHGGYSLIGTIHPKAEPEIAFKTKKDLAGKISIAEAKEACEAVAAAIEILDSRFVGFKYFSLNDVVADNASSSHVLLSHWNRSFHDLDLEKVEMKFFINDKLVDTAFGSAISGNPWNSLCQLSELMHSRGKVLPAGSVVLAGAPVQAVSLEPGMQVRSEVSGFEEAYFSVKTS